jgi:hypothetical protein
MFGFPHLITDVLLLASLPLEPEPLHQVGLVSPAQALWRKRNLRITLDTIWLTAAIGLGSYGWAGNEDRCPAWTSRAVCRVGMGHLEIISSGAWQ